jgi:hypothetical protein
LSATIHPSGLPDGAVGFPYDAALAGSGGHEPYEFSISRGALPPGITMIGPVLAGTASAAGTYTLTIMMQDAALELTTRAYAITILPIVPFITVEDGSIVPGANSYLGLLDLYYNQANLGGAPMTSFANLNPTAQTNLLIWATAYLDRRFRFYGQTLDQAQPLQWPRTRNYDPRGFPIEPGTIPIQLQQALAFLVTAAAANPTLMNIENSAFPVKQSAWSMDGVSMTYGNSSLSSTAEDGAAPLFEQQLPDLLILLRSIGELDDLTWITTDRQTVVTR